MFSLTAAMSGMSGMSGVAGVVAPPTTLLSDNFATDGDMNGRAMSPGPGVWTTESGTWATASGKGKETGGAEGIVTADAGALNVSVQVTLSTKGVGTDTLIARFVDADNYIAWRALQGSNVMRFSRKIGGSTATAGNASTAVTFNDGDIIKMIWVGNSVSCVFNGSVLHTYAMTAPEIAAVGAATKCALYANADATVRFDDFLVTTP